ncbi:uncharacterized protein zgc:154075 isoform X2 [Erpetoichthys calabaricus]|uniref:uncharacterized protein zgc:154075 isoform X2 n=1 Tax=Erpetoichthys calabaricus TaxID=27687 RepID=UPI002234ADD8|nr:uncharacterized protein zgc:154075 isoform X2 [Erpetoichthys calabaricus]
MCVGHLTVGKCWFSMYVGYVAVSNVCAGFLGKYMFGSSFSVACVVSHYCFFSGEIYSMFMRRHVLLLWETLVICSQLDDSLNCLKVTFDTSCVLLFSTVTYDCHCYSITVSEGFKKAVGLFYQTRPTSDTFSTCKGALFAMATRVDVIIIGAGNRGSTYARFAEECPDQMRVVGVADPNLFARDAFKQKYRIEEQNVFVDWHEAAKREKFAHAAIICTPDHLHKEPALVFAKRGYHILLEKPMSVTPDDCLEIVSACLDSAVLLAVCHVLRYSPAVRKIKELIDSGAIGDVIHIQHLEPVGFYHFAHSFVRGNWRKESQSSFSLLTKSSHDIDLILYWLGNRRCLKVSSFGSLSHFSSDNKPSGATARCLDCPVEQQCPYSAKRIYLDMVRQGCVGWPVSVLCPTSNVDIESVTRALQTGPYGRCVYSCDNDVCTNQGELSCNNDSVVRVFDFLTQKETVHHVDNAGLLVSSLRAHGGSDYFLIKDFVAAIASGDAALIQSGPKETLASHLLVFAAEQARKENRIVFFEEEWAEKLAQGTMGPNTATPI